MFQAQTSAWPRTEEADAIKTRPATSHLCWFHPRVRPTLAAVMYQLDLEMKPDHQQMQESKLSQT